MGHELFQFAKASVADGQRLVIVASRFGLPVSTTHVSCGALFGLGAATGGARASTILSLVGAWIITLPIAAALAACAALVLT